MSVEMGFGEGSDVCGGAFPTVDLGKVCVGVWGSCFCGESCRVVRMGIEEQNFDPGIVLGAEKSGGRGMMGGTTLAPRPGIYSFRNFWTNLLYALLCWPWRIV